MKTKMTIGKKLMIGVGTMLALMIAMGGSSLNSIDRLNSQLVAATGASARSLQLGGMIDAAGSDMLAAQRGIVLFTYAKLPDNVRTAKVLFESAANTWQKSIDELRPLLVREDARKTLSEMQEQLTAWRAVVVELIQACDRGDPDTGTRIAVDKGLPIYQANIRASARFAEIQNETLTAQRADGASAVSISLWTAGIALALSIAVGMITLFVVRHTTITLQRAAGELNQNSAQVASAANQISSSSQGLAQGASEQAASIEETSASAEEIAAMTRKNADDSRQAAGLMGETSVVVEEANRTLEQMESSMREITSSSERIGRIIKVIDEIAFQTNILALNAAVEAARAGEAGLGFAVVADEVRNLAQRSAQAAKDTAAMIEESIAKSGEGRVKLEQVSKAIQGITEKASRVKGLVDGVSAGIGEQTRGVEQIAQAITQVEKVTQTSAASSEEVASAGEELTSQAAALRGIVQSLEQLVGGGQSQSEAPVRLNSTLPAERSLQKLAKAVAAKSQQPKMEEQDFLSPR